MFIHFEFLIDSYNGENIEAVVSEVNQAKSMCTFLEKSKNVIAWKMTNFKPEDFGMAPASSSIWTKLRADNCYTQEDWKKARGE